MPKHKITITFFIVGDESDDEAMRESVKEAMTKAVECDDAGDRELEFEIEEVDDE
jgi:hypothetical protein